MDFLFVENTYFRPENSRHKFFNVILKTVFARILTIWKNNYIPILVPKEETNIWLSLFILNIKNLMVYGLYQVRFRKWIQQTKYWTRQVGDN